jgi:flagellar protein FliO/FliZ
MTMLLWLQTVPGADDQFGSINTPIVQSIGVLLALFGVLALAYATLRFGLPRMLGMGASHNGPIQVLARYPLEPRKTLYLVKAGSQVFLIGTSERQVEYLTTIAPENILETPQVAPRQKWSPASFRQVLGLQKSGKV